MAKIALVLATNYEKVKPVFSNQYLWCFIGKNIDLRNRISKKFSEKRRFHVKDRLHKIAEEFRKPYLEFVADLGSQQDRPLYWWASRFASKSPFQTDFFLLLCYKILVKRLIDEFLKRQQNLYMFIEDPWLFFDLKREYKSKNIIFIGNKYAIYREKLFFIAKGIFYRVLLIAYLIISKSLTILFFKRKIDLNESNKVVGILSFAEERAFTADNEYKDPYTGDLSQFLKKNGFQVIRPILINIPIKLIRKVCSCKSNLWPLINDFKIQDLKNIFKYWKLEIKQDPILKGYTLSTLLKREQLEEFSKVGFNRYLILFNIVKRFLSRKYCSALIYLYENQPWEKIVCMAAKEVGNIKLIGYQHSTIPKFLLMYFLGKKEAEFIPLPDRIITNSYFHKSLLEKSNYPKNKLTVGGSWRYEYLFENSKFSISIRKDAKNIRVLVALPVNKDEAKMILETIYRACSNNDKELKLTFLIKAHPDIPLNKLKLDIHKINNFNFINDPLYKVIKEADIVISSGTPSVEALYCGKNIIRIIPETMLDLDPLSGLGISQVLTCYDESEFKEKILIAVQKIKNNAVEYKKPIEFFEKVKPEVWIKELSDQNVSETQ